MKDGNISERKQSQEEKLRKQSKLQRRNLQTSGLPDVQLKEPGRKTWQQSYDFAISLGFRLPSLEEGQAYIALKGQLITTGDLNIYVPVGNPSQRDWMLIGRYGTSYLAGHSHASHGGYPSWGDNAAQYPQFKYTLIIRSYCNYQQAITPVITDLSYSSLAISQILDLAGAWTSEEPLCSYSCVIKAEGCINSYVFSNLSATGTLISGINNVLDGWTETVCLECTANNGQILQKDSNIFSQTALNCDASLVPISQASPIQFPYANGGAGVTYPYTTFFTLTPISGCILNCNYGDTCGLATTLSGTDVSITNAAYPQEINAKNNVKIGYEKSLCLQCSSNNAVSLFTNTFNIKQPLLDCQYSQTAPQISILDFLGSQPAFVQMADYSTSFATSISDCSIDGLVIKAVGCSTTYSGNNLQVNGKTIEGKQNIAGGYSETVCLQFTDSSGVIYNIDSLAFSQNLPECNFIKAYPSSQISTHTYSATETTFLQMAEYSNEFTSSITVCSIASLTLKANGCGTSYSGNNLQVNGKTIEGKQNIVAGFSESVCIEFTDSSNYKYNIDSLTFKQTPYYPPVLLTSTCTHQDPQQETETEAMCKSILSEDYCSKNTTLSGAIRCQWINPDGVSANCNNIQSLVPSIVQDIKSKTENIIDLVNATIKYKIILKTQKAEAYIIAVNNFLYWNGTATEEFCGPKKIMLCESSSCLTESSSQETKLDTNPTYFDFEGKMNPILTISRTAPFNKLIHISASNPYAYPSAIQSIVTGIVVVCGEEKVIMKDKSNKVFNINGVKNSSSPILSFNLAGIWDVDTNGLLQSPQDCPIQEWKMCDDAFCEASTDELWQTLKNNILSVDISNGIPLVSKFLVAMTTGKAKGSHPIIIMICGQEKISSISQTKIYQKFVGATTETIDIMSHFENSDKQNCPITSYSIESSSNQPLLLGVNEDSIVSLEGTKLQIKFTEIKTYSFNIVAKTSSGQFGKLMFNVQVIPISNSPPYFLIQMQENLKVYLTKGLDGEIEDDFDIIYISPKAFDEEKDKILMSFDGEEDFMQIKQKDDDTFQIKIIHGLLPQKSTNYTVSIELEDERGAKQKMKLDILIEVEFLNKQKEADKEEKINQESSKIAADEQMDKANNETKSMQAMKNNSLDNGDLQDQVTKDVGKDFQNGEGASKIAKKEGEVVLEKPKETAIESALVQEKGEPKIQTQGPSVSEWQTQIDPEVMKAQIAISIRLAKLKAQEARKKYEMKQEKAKKEKTNFPPPTPVGMNMESITPDGNITMKFNQPLIIPEFVKNAQKIHSEKSKKRQLEEGEFDSINVNEIIGITLAQKSDEDPGTAKFYLGIESWDDKQIQLKMNFSIPLSISKGRNQDAIIVDIKNPGIFISVETGLSMQNSFGANSLAQKIPKQVPLGVDAVAVKKRAQNSALFIKTMMIIQIILSVFLKGAMNDLWGLYFTLQLLCYITVYDVFLPQSIEQYLQEFIKIIEFEILSPEGAIKLFYPDFNLSAFISGYKVAINKDQEASVIKDMQVYIMILVLVCIGLVLAIGSMVVLKKYAQKIKKNLEKAKNKLLWNGAVRSLYISFAQLLYTTTIQIKMIIRGSRYIEQSSIYVSVGTTIYCLLTIMLITFTLFRLKNKLGDRQVKNTYESMYLGVNYIRKGGYKLYFWPIFLFRRILFFTIPIVLIGMRTLQIQILCFYTSLYIILIVSIQPNLDKKETLKEIFNEVMTMISCYHMFCFTEFNMDDEQKYNMGHSYVFFVGITFVFNVYMMVWNNIITYKRKVRMLAKQTNFRTNKESILRSEHVGRLYELKTYLNTNLNLKSEYCKQEEKRMIKKLERQFLKQEEAHHRAKQASNQQVLKKVDKPKTKFLRKARKMTVIREVTNETISDEENQSPASSQTSQKLIKQASSKLLDLEIKQNNDQTKIEESKKFETVQNIQLYSFQSPKADLNPKNSTDQKMKRQLAELLFKNKIRRAATKPSTVEFKQKSPKPAISLLSNMKSKMQMRK